MRVILRAEHGSTRAVAARPGLSPRTVQRYRPSRIGRPGRQLAAALKREARRS
ncbi:hypothetical protein [Streptomyces hainanensis]|uniref:hypothetical protein n=1 Tax=Streptomyces hainanensis TaxID=402648 RepID=UPI00140555D0|nr:hypothetical protein [Streptomyces hainanensis]